MKHASTVIGVLLWVALSTAVAWAVIALFPAQTSAPAAQALVGVLSSVAVMLGVYAAVRVANEKRGGNQ